MSLGQTSNSKQAAWVAIGSFFSFIVSIISSMILSRFFDKGDYGTYKQVMYVYSTLLAVFTLGLPKAYAYFLPKYATNYSRDIISKVTKIFFILGAAFSLFLLCCAGPIASVMNNPDLRSALIVFSPTPFLLLPTMGLDAIYASFRKTKYLAYYTIATRILTIICIVFPVVIEPNIIPTNGSSMNPFENSAKVSVPKYLLIKSWVADDMITPHKDAYKSGSANLNISLYVNELF